MQINLEKRKSININKNVIHLDVVISNDKSQLLIGCCNLGYHSYDIINGKYKYASKINLNALHESSMFCYVKVTFDDLENVLSFFNNQSNELLFTINKEEESIVFNDFSTNGNENGITFSLSTLEGHHQYFNFYGIVLDEDTVYFKLDDVVYQLVKNNNEFDSLFPLEENEEDEYYEIEQDLYDSASFIKAINPPLEKFPKKAIDMVQIKRCDEYSDGQTTEGTEIFSKRKNHVYLFAGKLSYDGEDCSVASYEAKSEVKKEKKENTYPISDNTWNYLTNFSDNTIGLKEGSANSSAWINAIIERLNAITDNEEAIRKMFALQQKIGIAKAVKPSYFGEKYPEKVYKNLEKTLDILLKERFKK